MARATDTSAILEAKNIGKKYEGHTLFASLSMRIFPGEVVSIQGRSGEGKSTLLHILSGIEPPSEGELYFENRNFQNIALDRLRNRSFGFVFQAFHLMEERDALSNVLFPVEIARWPEEMSRHGWTQRAEELLRRVGLYAKRHQKAAQLSGGEKQRVCIARALILYPAVLFLDEPTGNLDEETAHEIMSLLFSLHREGSISSLLMVTHDPILASKADRRYILRHGSLHEVEYGSVPHSSS